MSTRPAAAGRLALSIVAPCYNEAQGLALFVERTMAAAKAAAGSAYELILINDGSRDATWNIIRDLSQRHSSVVGVNLTRNHGHQLSVTAGLSLCRGARVLIIDADLQDPPELLSAMMARMDEGYDVVYGRRRTRANESRVKRVTAALFYRLLGRLSEVIFLSIPATSGLCRGGSSIASTPCLSMIATCAEWWPGSAALRPSSFTTATHVSQARQAIRFARCSDWRSMASPVSPPRPSRRRWCLQWSAF